MMEIILQIIKETNMRKQRQYRRQFAIWMGLYAVMFFPMIMLMAVTEVFTPWASSLRCLFVLLPLVPMFLALRAFIRSLDSLDELQRRIHLEAFAFSLSCICMLTFSYGMLEAFVDQQHVSLIFVLPMAIIFWFVGVLLARRRYQ
jgi:hypothetical protein